MILLSFMFILYRPIGYLFRWLYLPDPICMPWTLPSDIMGCSAYSLPIFSSSTHISLSHSPHFHALHHVCACNDPCTRFSCILRIHDDLLFSPHWRNEITEPKSNASGRIGDTWTSKEMRYRSVVSNCAFICSAPLVSGSKSLERVRLGFDIPTGPMDGINFVDEQLSRDSSLIYEHPWFR